MNTIDTIPELKKATLNGIEGLGYAEVYQNVRGMECRGVIVFDENTDLTELRDPIVQKNARFEGAVYQDAHCTFESLAVQVVLVSQDEHLEPGVTFKVTVPQH